MTRDAQLAFCKKCTNRKMDLQNGMLCNLTDRKADFTGTCNDFNEDTEVQGIVEQPEALDRSQLVQKLSEKDMNKLKEEQNLIPAIAMGATVGLVGAILWGTISVLTGFQIGYMAIAIGAGVGYSIRLVGKGITEIFGYWGGGIALLSVVLGNILSIMGFVANEMDVSLVEALLFFDYSYLPEVMAETFSPIDLLFYGLATYEGYKFSFRVLTQEDIDRIHTQDSSPIIK